MKTQGIISVVVILALIALVVYMQRTHRPVDIRSSEAAVSGESSDTPQQSAPTVINQTPPPSMNASETTTPDGLKITIVKEGVGQGAVAGNTVSVNYTGSFPGGAVFDSNIDPKFGHVEPLSFTLGKHMVIAGWDEGVVGMKVGEKRHLVIPPNLGYGAAGAQGVIPPNATLEFDVELLAIK